MFILDENVFLKRWKELTQNTKREFVCVRKSDKHFRLIVKLFIVFLMLFLISISSSYAAEKNRTVKKAADMGRAP